MSCSAVKAWRCTKLAFALYWLAWLTCVLSEPEAKPVLLTGQHANGTFSFQGTQEQPVSIVAPVSLEYPAFHVTGGSNFSLEHVILDDQSRLIVRTEAVTSLRDLLLLPWLGLVAPSATARLVDVQLRTSCEVLQVFHNTVCSILEVHSRNSMTIMPGILIIPKYASSTLIAQNVRVTCDLNTTTPALAQASMACAVGHAQGWTEMVALTESLQQASQVVHLVLDGPVYVPPSYTSSGGSMNVTTELHIEHEPSLASWQAVISMDPASAEGVWTIAKPTARLIFDGIIFSALPFGPPEKYPLSMLPWGMWFVRQDRCQGSPMAVTLTNCTLMVQPGTMDYMSHWAGELLSVFPNKQQAAQWYGTDYTCNPPYERPLLQKQLKEREQEIQLSDQATWIVLNSSTLGIELHNIIVTSQPIAGVVPTLSGLPLTQLFEDPYLALPYITMVSTAEQFVQFLLNETTSYLVLLANISIPRSMWPAQPIKLTNNLSISGWPNRPTVLDWQGATDVLDMGGHTLEFRNLMLLNGGQESANADIPWAANLTMYQWPVKCDRSDGQRSSLRLESVTVVVPPSELSIMRTCMVRFKRAASLSPGTVNQGACELLSWVKTGGIRPDQACSFAQFQDAGMSGSNVTFTDVPLAFARLNYDVVLRVGSDQVTSAGDGSHSGQRGLPVLPVVLPIVGGLVLIMCIAAWIISRKGKAAGKGQQGTGVEKGTGGWSKGDDVEQGQGHDGPTNNGDGQYHPPAAGQQQRTASGPAGGMLTPYSSRGGDVSVEHSNMAVAGLLPQGGVYSAQYHRRESLRSHSGHPSEYNRSGSVHVPVHGSASGPPSQQIPKLATRPVSIEHSQMSYVDSFEAPVEDASQLLINKWGLGADMQGQSQAPDVATQLKTMVSHMQDELGDQEVQIIKLIGQGGGGVVHQGLWRGLIVAVKSLVFTVVPSQPMSNRQQRAMTEAAICKTLQHPNIVATYSYDLQALHAAKSGPASADRSAGHSSSSTQLRGSPAAWDSAANVMEFKLLIIQEYCDSGTLKSAIDEGRLEPGEAAEHRSSVQELGDSAPRPDMAPVLQVALDVARGMCHVHTRNIVHGDLTPANVLLKATDHTVSGLTAKVADFGLSWKLSSGKDHVSNAQQGTGFYISPEVLHVGIMSKAADVFSFGMILHEMYHGTPFWRKQHGFAGAAAAAAVMKGPGMEQLTWAAHCPAPYKALVTACLSPNPQARPSFESIARSLQAMQNSCQSGGKMAGSDSLGLLLDVAEEEQEGEAASGDGPTVAAVVVSAQEQQQSSTTAVSVADQDGPSTPTTPARQQEEEEEEQVHRQLVGRGSPASCPDIQPDSDFERSIEQLLCKPEQPQGMRAHLASTSSKDFTSEGTLAGPEYSFRHAGAVGSSGSRVLEPPAMSQGTLESGSAQGMRSSGANWGVQRMVGHLDPHTTGQAASHATPGTSIVLFSPVFPAPSEQQPDNNDFPLQLEQHQAQSGLPCSCHTQGERLNSNVTPLDGYLLQADKAPEVCSMQSLSSPMPMGQGHTAARDDDPSAAQPRGLMVRSNSKFGAQQTEPAIPADALPPAATAAGVNADANASSTGPADGTAAPAGPAHRINN